MTRVVPLRWQPIYPERGTQLLDRTRKRLRCRLYQPGLVRRDDGLRTAGQAQLRHHALDVGLHGGLAEHQILRDLRVGQAVADEAQDLRLTRGQLREVDV